MAVKNHSLDNLIIEASKIEFKNNGFLNASLRNIASNAGITTGALYTRYKNKDELFESLITLNFENIKYPDFTKLYQDIKETKDVNKFLEVIKQEEKFYLDFLFDYYDECVLMICKSDGSKIGQNLKKMMENKASQTVLYFKSLSQKDFEYDGIRLIMQEQFLYYKEILNKGYTKEKAIEVMKVVSLFLEAGWKKIFEQII